MLLLGCWSPASRRAATLSSAFCAPAVGTGSWGEKGTYPNAKRRKAEQQIFSEDVGTWECWTGRGAKGLAQKAHGHGASRDRLWLVEGGRTEET